MVLGPNPTAQPRTLIPEELLALHLAQQAIALAATIMAAAASAPVVEVGAAEAAAVGVEAAEAVAVGAGEAEVVAVGAVVADAKSYSPDTGLTGFLHHNNHVCFLVSWTQGRVCCPLLVGFSRVLGASMGFWFFLVFFRDFSFLALYITPLECMIFHPLDHNWVAKKSLTLHVKRKMLIRGSPRALKRLVGYFTNPGPG